MQNILVTGAAGFIGSNVSEMLLKKDYNVIGIDSFNDFYSPLIKRGNANEIVKTAESIGANFKLYEGDIRNGEVIDRVFAENKIEAVIHLAAYAGVRPSIENPELYFDVNINGTVKILECIKKYGIKRHVFASSSSVYGNNKKVPFSEQDPVDNAISPYAATKKAGEVICYTYHHLYDINTACLRFFTVYGPRQRPDLAIHKFTKLMVEGKPIPFFGDGSMKRDHTYIDDILDGVYKALIWTDSPKKRYDIFNLGESHTITLTELVEAISDELGINPIINRLPMQQGDVNRTFADISKAKKILGYNPQTNFEEGIKKFIKWFRTREYASQVFKERV
ncbi:MAG: epimerase [Firmicutes bacterium HGW-Firmicutes-8]|nr:MAG: epimerase [Firmicutes bacterium HGW-Firmicutes-8]